MKPQMVVKALYSVPVASPGKPLSVEGMYGTVTALYVPAGTDGSSV
jgi:hypothetical protein